jgi:hypothetical protein
MAVENKIDRRSSVFSKSRSGVIRRFCFFCMRCDTISRVMKPAMPTTRHIQFASHSIQFDIEPAEILSAVDLHFKHCIGTGENSVAAYQVRAEEEATYSILRDGAPFQSKLSADRTLWYLMQDGLTQLNGAPSTELVFHAAGLSLDGNGLILCGKSGSGKSTLTAWLTASGFQYLSDEVIALPLDGGTMRGFCRSIILKRGSAEIWKRWVAQDDPLGFQKMDDNGVWIAPTFLNPNAVCRAAAPRLLVFPTFTKNASLQSTRLSPASALFQWMQMLVNARNLPEHGMKTVKQAVLSIPAYRLIYSDIQQAAEWIRKTIAQP